jgi:hypothetical protein
MIRLKDIFYTVIIAFIFAFTLTLWQIRCGFPILLRANLTEIIMIVIYTLIVLISSYFVRKYKKGNLPNLSGVMAYRFFLLGQVAILGSVALISLYSGMLLGSYQLWEVIWRTIFNEVALIISATIMLISGIFSYFTCKIDPPSDSLCA